MSRAPAKKAAAKAQDAQPATQDALGAFAVSENLRDISLYAAIERMLQAQGTRRSEMWKLGKERLFEAAMRVVVTGGTDAEAIRLLSADMKAKRVSLRVAQRWFASLRNEFRQEHLRRVARLASEQSFAALSGDPIQDAALLSKMFAHRLFETLSGVSNLSMVDPKTLHPLVRVLESMVDAAKMYGEVEKKKAEAELIRQRGLAEIAKLNSGASKRKVSPEQVAALLRHVIAGDEAPKLEDAA